MGPLRPGPAGQVARADYRAMTLDEAMVGDVYTPPHTIDLGRRRRPEERPRARGVRRRTAGAPEQQQRPRRRRAPGRPPIDAGILDLPVVARARLGRPAGAQRPAGPLPPGHRPGARRPTTTGGGWTQPLTEDRLRGSWRAPRTGGAGRSRSLASRRCGWTSSPRARRQGPAGRPRAAAAPAHPDRGLAPVFAASGELLTAPGYHPASRTYYEPHAHARPGGPRRAEPTAPEVRCARGEARIRRAARGLPLRRRGGVGPRRGPAAPALRPRPDRRPHAPAPDREAEAGDGGGAPGGRPDVPGRRGPPGHHDGGAGRGRVAQAHHGGAAGEPRRHRDRQPAPAPRHRRPPPRSPRRTRGTTAASAPRSSCTSPCAAPGSPPATTPPCPTS